MSSKPSAYYRLRIKSLKFISAVDAGAQGPVANVALIKRAPSGTDIEAVCHVAKVDEKLGLVFGWALASSLDGGATPHVDLQKDAILGDDDLIKVSAAFMENGGPSDVLHDENPDGKIVFALPITKDVAAALGIKSDVHGLAIAMRPSPETFKRFVDRELNAFSIGGLGERELVEKAASAKCASCSAYMKSDDEKCSACGTAKSVTKYNPDQDRDDHGRFGGGGGGGGGDAIHHSEAAARASEHAYNASPSEHSSANLDAARAHGSAAEAHRQAGNHAAAAEHNNRAADHAAVVGSGLSVRPGPMTSPGTSRPRTAPTGAPARAPGGGAKVDASNTASAMAEEASQTARNTRTAGAHADAAIYHHDAAIAAHAAGNKEKADLHANLAGGHAISASHAARATGTPSDHNAAHFAHSASVNAANSRAEIAHDAGDSAAARKFSDKAVFHEKAKAEHNAALSKPPAKSKPRRKRFEKQAVLTSSEDGHQHQIDLDDPADQYYSDKLRTTDAVADGADNPHSHDWVFDAATGEITIAESAGHSHTAPGVVPADVLRTAALNEDGDRCQRCGQMSESDCKFCPNCGCAMGDSGNAVPTAVTDDKSKSGPTLVAIQLSASEPISTPPDETPTVKSEPKENATMAVDALTILTDKHDKLEKRNLYLEKLVALTDAQRAYHAKLVGQDADVFLSKSHLEREIEISEVAKADEIIYTSPITGEVFRKSCPPRELKLQKQADEATIANREIAKRAADMELAQKGDVVLSHFAKGSKGNMRGRLMKAVNAEFTDPTEYEEMIEALKGMNVAMKEALTAKGHTPTSEASPQDPQSQLTQLAKKYADEHKVDFAKAYSAVLATPRGAALYADQSTARA